MYNEIIWKWSKKTRIIQWYPIVDLLKCYICVTHSELNKRTNNNLIFLPFSLSYPLSVHQFSIYVCVTFVKQFSSSSSSFFFFLFPFLYFLFLFAPTVYMPMLWFWFWFGPFFQFQFGFCVCLFFCCCFTVIFLLAYFKFYLQSPFTFRFCCRFCFVCFFASNSVCLHEMFGLHLETYNSSFILIATWGKARGEVRWGYKCFHTLRLF